MIGIHKHADDMLMTGAVWTAPAADEMLAPCHVFDVVESTHHN
jgi:hypothetical protein